jgi:Phosphotransferase enzyme family
MKTLAQACAMASEVVARHGNSLPPAAGGALVSGAELTSTGVAVVVLSPRYEPPCLVIKMPLNPAATRGLTREGQTLSALHADDRLRGWRGHVPVPLADGTLRGQAYRIDSALVGRTLGRLELQTPILRTAAAAISRLHRATAEEMICSAEVADHWVDAPVRVLSEHTQVRSSLAASLTRLRDELRQAVIDRSFTVSRIHGDYWPGNVLFSNGELARTTVTGIVDWESSAARDLPLHDLLHLLLYTRRLRTGRELGHIVRELLHTGWSHEERFFLDELQSRPRDGALSERHSLLLYWLRHVAMHTRQETSSCRYWWWRRRAVLPVLDAL